MRTNDKLSVSKLRETLLARDRKRRKRRGDTIEAASLRATGRNDLLPDLGSKSAISAPLRSPQRNVRQINSTHVQEVARSINGLGFSTPVIIDSSGTITIVS